MSYKTARDWKPLERATADVPNEEAVELLSRSQKISTKAAREILDAYNAESEYWINGLYQVQVRRHTAQGFAHLNIRRRDGKAIFRDWRHFQWIKNQLIGEECEAVELYPAESRLVDASNKYHLFCALNPKFRFPLGFDERDVDYAGGNTNGTRQRPL
jgi:hypothetical protein